jgi:hypothetical protein
VEGWAKSSIKDIKGDCHSTASPDVSVTCTTLPLQLVTFKDGTQAVRFGIIAYTQLGTTYNLKVTGTDTDPQTMDPMPAEQITFTVVSRAEVVHPGPRRVRTTSTPAGWLTATTSPRNPRCLRAARAPR